MLPYFQQIPVSPYNGIVNPTPIKVAAPSGARPYVVACPVDWLALSKTMLTASGALGVNFALGSLQNSGQFDAILSVIVDNRNNLRPVYLVFPDTGWTVECPPGVLRSYPVVSNVFGCTAYCDHVVAPTDTQTKFYFSNVPSQIFEMNDVADNISNVVGSFGQIYPAAVGDYQAGGILGLSAISTPINSQGAYFNSTQTWIPTYTKAAMYPYVTNTQALVAAQNAVAGNVNPSYLPTQMIITSFRMVAYNVRVATTAAISFCMLLDGPCLYGFNTLFARPDYTGVAKQTLYDESDLFWPTSWQNQVGIGANYWYGVGANPFIGGYVEYSFNYAMR